MTDNIPEEFNLGLLDEEIDDLEKLIKELKADPSLSDPNAAFEKSQRQIKTTTKNLIGLVEMMLRFDTELKSFYEILRLSHKKSEIMNKHLNAMIQWVTGEKNNIEE